MARPPTPDADIYRRLRALRGNGSTASLARRLKRPESTVAKWIDEEPAMRADTRRALLPQIRKLEMAS